MAKGKNKKTRNKVIFEHEIITKENADQILSSVPNKKVKDEDVIDFLDTGQHKQGRYKTDNSELNVPISKQKKRGQKKQIKNSTETNKNKKHNESENPVEDVTSLNESKELPRKKKKRNKSTISDDSKDVENSSEELNEPPKKKNKQKENENDESDGEEAEEEAENTNQKKPKQPESNRALKRKKHAKLLEDKKLQSEIKMQQNCLNYLSKWKHSKADWKFEKLKQVWLHLNLLDSTKVPDEFWETTVEYFTGSKGFIRNAVLKNALKIIEQEEKVESEDLDKDVDSVKLKRARDIVQSLQE